MALGGGVAVSYLPNLERRHAKTHPRFQKAYIRLSLNCPVYDLALLNFTLIFQNMRRGMSLWIVLKILATQKPHEATEKDYL